MAFLTMELLRQPLAADGNGCRYIKPFSGLWRAERLPSVAPLCSITVPSQSAQNGPF